jgi:hypothetical protein
MTARENELILHVTVRTPSALQEELVAPDADSACESIKVGDLVG